MLASNTLVRHFTHKVRPNFNHGIATSICAVQSMTESCWPVLSSSSFTSSGSIMEKRLIPLYLPIQIHRLPSWTSYPVRHCRCLHYQSGGFVERSFEILSSWFLRSRESQTLELGTQKADLRTWLRTFADYGFTWAFYAQDILLSGTKIFAPYGHVTRRAFQGVKTVASC